MYVQLPGTFTFAEALLEAAKDKYVVNGTVPHLLTVESGVEELFLFQYYYNYVWIGAQDMGTPQNHDFRWVTGPNIGQELKYFGGWMRGQPDRSGNMCLMDQYDVEVQIQPEWALVPCDLKLWIVLEYEGLHFSIFFFNHSGNTIPLLCSIQHASLPWAEQQLLRVRTLRHIHVDSVGPDIAACG